MLALTPLDISQLPEVKAIHEASGFDYQMPDLTSPLFVVTLAAVDDSGKLLGAGALKLQAETYLWLDKNQSTRVRLEVVLSLGKALAAAAWRVGLDCMVAYLPPSLPKSFKRVLSFLGWNAARSWEPWYKDINDASRTKSSS